MNKLRSSHDKSREVMNKLYTSWELAEALKDLKTTFLGGWWVGGGWFNSFVRLRLSQPSLAGDLLAGWLGLSLALSSYIFVKLHSALADLTEFYLVGVTRSLTYIYQKRLPLPYVLEIWWLSLVGVSLKT